MNDRPIRSLAPNNSSTPSSPMLKDVMLSEARLRCSGAPNRSPTAAPPTKRVLRLYMARYSTALPFFPTAMITPAIRRQ